MKFKIVFLALLIPFLAIAQKKSIEIQKTKDGDAIVLTAKNTTTQAQEVEVTLESEGMGLKPEEVITKVLPAKSEAEMIRFQPQAGQKWSYGYKYKYTLSQAAVAEEAVASPSTPTATTTAEETKLQEQKEKPSEAVAEKGIVVYSKKGCGRCTATISHLKKHDIDFKEVNITKNEKNMKKLSKALYANGFSGGRFQTPVISVDGTLHYKIPDLRAFLDELSSEK